MDYLEWSRPANMEKKWGSVEMYKTNLGNTFFRRSDGSQGVWTFCYSEGNQRRESDLLVARCNERQGFGLTVSPKETDTNVVDLRYSLNLGAVAVAILHS
jgi:hypothetical protein